MAPTMDSSCTGQVSKVNGEAVLDPQAFDPHVLSLPSEAPDIRNYFSSYEYESPPNFELECDFNGPGTSREGISHDKDAISELNENLQDSGDERDSEFSEKPEKMAKCCEEFQDSEEDSKRNIKITDPSNLFSLPSEPPDIRNWFSSYEYDSPATLDLGWDVNDLKTCDEGNHYSKNLIESNAKPTGSSEKNDRDSSVKCSFNQYAEGAGIINDSNKGCCYLKKQDFSNLGKASESPRCSKSFDHQSFDQVLEMCCHRSPTNKENCHEISIQMSSSKACATDDDPGLSSRSRIESPDRNYSGSSEQKEVRGSGNTGFILTKRMRASKPKEQKPFCGSILMNCQQPFTGWKEPLFSDGRVALSNMTNFTMESSQEIPGKWKCPRKGKPYVGQPLKQLGLERWLSRAKF